MTKERPDLYNLSRDTKANDSEQTKITAPFGILPTSQQRICGDIGMHIDRHGTWHYRGSPIERKELVKLFSKVLRRDNLGNHWLITPTEIAPVRVDEVAHVVVSMEVIGRGEIQTVRFKTLVDTVYDLSNLYPLRLEFNPQTGEQVPYLKLDQGLEAKLNRSVFYDLANSAIEETVEGSFVLGIWSVGSFHIIGNVEKSNQ